MIKSREKVEKILEYDTKNHQKTLDKKQVEKIEKFLEKIESTFLKNPKNLGRTKFGKNIGKSSPNKIVDEAENIGK